MTSSDIVIKQEFARNLCRILKERKESVQIAADRMEMPRATLYSYAAGGSTPNVVNLVKLCEGLGCSPDELIGW